MDPFTVVTGSAGLLSTGIAVCSGLISYCRSYRSLGEDLSGLQQNAKRLKTQLQLLESRCQATQPTDLDLRNAIKECLTSCTKCLAEFRQLSDKYSPLSTGSSVRRRREVLSRRLRYPFQKDKFESFRQHINSLHIVLLGSMGVLNYDFNMATREESREQAKNLASLLLDGTEGIKSHIDTALPDLARMFDTEMSKAQGAITLKLDDFQSTLEKFIKDTMEKSLQPVSQPRLSVGTREIIGSPTSAGPSLDPPSSQVMYLVPNLDKAPAKKAETEQRDFLPPVPVTDDFFLSSTHLRARRKPSSKFQEKRTAKILSGTLRVLNYLVQIRVVIEYSQLAVLRDLRIQPNLTIRATVPSDCPAFRLVGGIVQTLNSRRFPTEDDVQTQMQNCLRDLQGLFISGQSWPTDVDLRGKSLMDVILEVKLFHLKPEMAQICANFLEALVDLHVPFDWHSKPLIRGCMFFFADLERYPVYTANSSAIMRVMMTGFARLGAELWDTTDHLRNPGPYIFKSIGPDMLGQHYSIGYPALSYALLQKSEANITALLSGKCEMDRLHVLRQRGPWDQTPLHVSTCWPQGLRLIFDLAGEAVKNVIDMEDNEGRTALDYAVRLGELDCVKLLVTAGQADILLADLESGVALFYLQQPRRSQEELSFLARILADCRRKLYQMAARTLQTFDRLESGAIGNEGLALQENAYEIVQRLQATKVDIPKTFQFIRPGSIYHYLYAPSVELLEALYQAGFSHTNVSCFGLYPLMTLAYPLWRVNLAENSEVVYDPIGMLEGIIWFRDHGADLHVPLPRNAISGTPGQHDESREFRLIHQLSAQLGCVEGTALTRNHKFETRVASMLHEIVLSPAVDPCSCFCSPKGCSTIKLLAGKRCGGDTESLTECLTAALSVASRLDPGSDTTFRVVSDLFRLMTFERLGMVHTCCKHIHGYYNRHVVHNIVTGKSRLVELMDPEDIGEFQEEDQHLSLLLEELVLDLEKKYRSLGIPLWDFYSSHWLPRMAEVDAERIDLSPEEQDAIREIGVVIHDI